MISDATRSLETAASGAIPKSRTRIGVISAPPPIPVRPTAKPTISPASATYRSMCTPRRLLNSLPRLTLLAYFAGSKVPRQLRRDFGVNGPGGVGSNKPIGTFLGAAPATLAPRAPRDGRHRARAWALSRSRHLPRVVVRAPGDGRHHAQACPHSRARHIPRVVVRAPGDGRHHAQACPHSRARHIPRVVVRAPGDGRHHAQACP